MNGNPFGEYVNEIPNYTSNSWIEKELARRYLVGALLHVNKDLKFATRGFRDEALVAANNIFIKCINQLALVYDCGLGDHKNNDPQPPVYFDDTDDVAECKLCRRECPIEPSSGLCQSCDHQTFPESRNHVDDYLENR